MGSATGVDFYIRDPSLQGNHINITFDDGLWMISAHPGCHSCIVNGEPMETAVIEDGDRLLVGRFDMIFRESLPA